MAASSCSYCRTLLFKVCSDTCRHLITEVSGSQVKTGCIEQNGYDGVRLEWFCLAQMLMIGIDISCLYMCKIMPSLCFYSLLLPASMQQHGIQIDLKGLILQRDSTSARTCEAQWHFKTCWGAYWGILLLTFSVKHFECVVGERKFPVLAPMPVVSIFAKEQAGLGQL